MLTMYGLTKLLNAELAKRGSDKRVREQMMYNYRANKLVKVNSDGKIAEQDAIAFVTKYCDKHAPVKSA